MKNLNAPLLANWISTTSNFEILKMLRDGIAKSLTGLSTELIESIPAAVGDVELPIGNFNCRSIIGWVESIGSLSQYLKDGLATEPVVMTISIYKLILRRFPQVQTVAKESVITPASETISQEKIQCTPTDKSTSTTEPQRKL